ncbi:MAG: glutamate racemase [Undibacterium sp.]
MKIGIFDSGLGGLIVTQSLIRALPEYEYVYLGDTARVPYGNRSQEAIHAFTHEAVEFLFEQECELILIACNTASAEALRRLQKEYLPKHFPDRKMLGVLLPTAEEAVRVTKSGKIGVLATAGTVASGAYEREISKLRPNANIVQVAAPLLVPLIENAALKYVEPILRDYLAPFSIASVDTLVLGCTHYPFLKSAIRSIVGEEISIVSQDEIIGSKLRHYLMRHPEIESRLSRAETRRFLLTDISPSTIAMATTLFGEPIDFEKIQL